MFPVHEFLSHIIRTTQAVPESLIGKSFLGKSARSWSLEGGQTDIVLCVGNAWNSTSVRFDWKYGKLQGILHLKL